VTATLAQARSIPDWLTTSPRLRFDIATTRAILASIIARADRRPMPYCRSVSLGEILGDFHAVKRQVAVPVPPPSPPTRS
jgi:hypothetical protein